MVEICLVLTHDTETLWQRVSWSVKGKKLIGDMQRTYIGASDSHLSVCFRLLAPKFWEAVGIYECYFVTLWLQVEWWGHLEVVGTLRGGRDTETLHAVIKKVWTFALTSGGDAKTSHLCPCTHSRSSTWVTWWNFHYFCFSWS